MSTAAEVPASLTSSTATAPVEDPPKIARLRTFLNRTTRIEITDGRIFQGQFMCIDNSKNIILSGAYEISPPNRNAPNSEHRTVGAAEATESKNAPASSSSSARQEGEKRYVGLVMVPGPHIIRAEVDTAHLRATAGGVPSSSTGSAGQKYDADYLMG